nr:unnamed protein product [Callosobruchus analis]
MDTQIQGGGVPEPSDRNAALESVGDPLNEHKYPIMDEQPSTSKSQEIPVPSLEKENKITARTTDNAANIVAAVRGCQWRHIPCFAHCINLIVQEGVREISETTKKVKNIVEFFKRSSHALAKLQRTQGQMNFPQLKLKQDVVTRWNSTYDMLSRILEIKEAVISTLAILNNEMGTSLSVQDWQIIKYAIDILKMFVDITIEIS